MSSPELSEKYWAIKILYCDALACVKESHSRLRFQPFIEWDKHAHAQTNRPTWLQLWMSLTKPCPFKAHKQKKKKKEHMNTWVGPVVYPAQWWYKTSLFLYTLFD